MDDLLKKCVFEGGAIHLIYQKFINTKKIDGWDLIKNDKDIFF